MNPVVLSDEQIDAAMDAYAALAVPAWCSNRHRPAMAAALRAAFACQASPKPVQQELA